MTATKIAELRAMRTKCPACWVPAYTMCVKPDGKPSQFPHRARFKALWVTREETE